MILFVARADYANVGHTFAKALRSVGVKSMAIAVVRRKTRTKMEQATIVSEGMACDMCKVADWVVFMHSRKPWKDRTMTSVAKGKKIAVFHGGTYYRVRPGYMNTLWNPIVDLSLIQTPNLLGLGAKNEHWVIPAVDTEAIQPVYRDASLRETSLPLTVGHFPTGVSKGTSIVVDGVNKARRFGALLKYVSSRPGSGVILWRKHLERMSKCDIIIDQMAPSHKGMKLGGWGVTALEAAALGKITMTIFNHSDEYVRQYGPHELVRVDNATMLAVKLQSIALCTPGYIRAKQEVTREWVERQHGLVATGHRLKKLLT